MLDAKHEYEVDMERAGWTPEPADPRHDRGCPGRAAAATVDLAGPPPGAPRAADRSPGRRRRPPPRVDPDEVTRTLASLADLRDRGAITPEEYEAKKADLLSRL